MPIDLTIADEAVVRVGRKPEALIPILQALQERYGYLPEETLRRVCETTEITPAAITGVAAFYDMFRMQPTGKHTVADSSKCRWARRPRDRGGNRRRRGGGTALQGGADRRAERRLRAARLADTPVDFERLRHVPAGLSTQRGRSKVKNHQPDDAHQ